MYKMSEQKDPLNPERITSRVHGVMQDHASSVLYVRELPPYVADEKPSGGGQNRGPSPLEYILMGLCA